MVDSGVHPRSLEVKSLALVSLGELYLQLGSRPSGLTNNQAAQHLIKYGANTILQGLHQSPILNFLKLFLSPLSLLLLGLSLISYLTGEPKGALVIFLIVLLSTLLTFIQEHKSSKAAEELKALVSNKATVTRDGVELELALDQLVPGDIVHLSAGALIPADIRILESKDLFVNESSLNGESLPEEKMPIVVDPEKITSIFDWNNICFMGSHVVSGTGKAIILRTGGETFFGELAKEITSQSKVSSFDQGIKKFTLLMIRFMFVMAPVVFLMNGYIKGDWVEAALFAIAVSIGLAPEMLPMLVTVNLAKGALAMAKKRVIVKRLNSIQNFGAMNILCTDKTGTLTQDQIIMEKYIDVAGQPDDRVLEFAYLNSHYQSGLKNLLDVAVLKYTDVHQKLHDVNTFKKVDEIPFDFQRRRMSVIVQKNQEKQILICKGAVEEILACCKYAQIGSDLVALDKSHHANVEKAVADLNNDGFRVIAVAIKEEPVTAKSYDVDDESELILLGYIAFLDPPKESAKSAIHALHQSGVKVKILTGDNPLITRKICHEVGLNVDQILLGLQIDDLSDEALGEIAEKTVVFAKMTPQQKARVISALQMRGHVVGYMGDGINDGPSLKVADVSISVDIAVDIAKQSADIILLEKSLLILQEGVLEGRKVFGNIMKYLKMSASSTFGNVLSMIGASAILPFLPMLPAQVLLNDLLYDFSQTSVPTDDVDQEYLIAPRAWDIAGIGRYMITIGPISSLFDYLTFAFLWFVMGANVLAEATLFQTGWFVESLLSQTLVVHVIRTGKIPFVQSKPSTPLLATTLTICCVAALLPYTAMGHTMEMQALPKLYWYGMALIIPSYLLLTQLVKTELIKRFGLI